MNKKVQNIAIFVKNLTSGGAEKQSILLARTLANKYNIYYIIFNGDKVHEKYMNMLKNNGIATISLRGSIFIRFREFVSYLRKKHVKIIFSYLTAANLYACIAGKLLGIKVFTGLRNARLPILKLWIDRFITNYCAEKSIANSYAGAEEFISKGFKKRKIVVITNCFAEINPYKKKVSKKKLKIITVGRFVKQKDYETAIRAFAQLKIKNIEFDIIGYGELKEQIKKWIQLYEVQNRVRIYINPNNIPMLLDDADIYLSTSLFEGTSNSIMEAMNANLPIIATNAGDSNKLVKDGINGYICAIGNVNEISSRLEQLLDNEKLRFNMGEKSKEILQQFYSSNTFQEKYMNLLSIYE